jgi:hypothetical protein
VYLLDGDDAFMPEKIARYEALWATHPDAVLVQAPALLIDESAHPLGDNYEKQKHQADYLRATYRLQDTDLYYSTSTLAFRRDFIRRVTPIDFSDGHLLFADSRLSSVAPLFGPIVALDDALTLWRQHARSVSTRDNLRDPLSGTLRRTGVFNHFARHHGFRPLHLWRNLRFHKQLARRYLPAWVSAPFVRNPVGQR